MIGVSIRSHLSGDVSFDWRLEGLICELRLPFACIVDRHGAHEGTHALARGAEKPVVLGEKHVLLAEDEPLVCMMMTDILSNLGLRVTAVGSLSDGMSLANEDFDAAVLDVNLDGALVYPLAAALAAKGVAIVFLTGYEASSIAAPYRSWPVLQKPLEPPLLEKALHTALAATGTSETATLPLAGRVGAPKERWGGRRSE